MVKLLWKGDLQEFVHYRRIVLLSVTRQEPQEQMASMVDYCPRDVTWLGVQTATSQN